ncbi:pleckstrin homology domain-containing family F member 2-like isoform X2 [Eriocheir sinensis]|uniref:pleckstrin homology domain-containing family F member 2-like isoform X2 n=1 Tax=Eriocheir sinensis TaxID=95602 RepID=UPI0021C87AAB|nr:pleckstrin homology domain-containing family F member 2-like isoform X2 [Eriocheir sinensis]
MAWSGAYVRVNSEANARRIAMVESCFGTAGQPLNEPGRVLVGEGVLTKMCRKKPKPRQFFLFNDILVYGNIVLNKKKYNKQHLIPLEEVQLSSLEDDGQFRNGWLIKTPTKSFAVYAATATEKSEWMAHINKCVSDLLRKSGKKAAENHAAVWVPDSDTSICMHCKKTQFTLINRRHHCRKCGKVVCGPCSNRKIVLQHQSSKPLRVCLSCHDELSSAQTQPSGHPNSFDTMEGEGSQSDGDKDSDDLDIVLLRDPYDHPAPAASPDGPAPPPRRTSRGQSPTEPQKQTTEKEKKEASDLIDLSGGLFGEATGEGDEDAPPPTLWWDDIDLKEPAEGNGGDGDEDDDDDGGNNEEEGMKERANDSSGDDDSDEDTDDPSLQSPQSVTETMTFYEGGEASNGETQAALDVSTASATSSSEKMDSPAATSIDSTPFTTPTDSTPTAISDTPASPMEQ